MHTYAHTQFKISYSFSQNSNIKSFINSPLDAFCSISKCHQLCCIFLLHNISHLQNKLKHFRIIHHIIQACLFINVSPQFSYNKGSFLKTLKCHYTECHFLTSLMKQLSFLALLHILTCII